MATSIGDLYSDRAKVLLEASFPFPEPKVPISYNFDQGTPAPELYPLEDLQDYVGRAVDMYGELACAYFGDAGYEEMTYGYAGLRETVAGRVARRDGRDVGKDGVMLTNGSSHGLSLIAQAYLGPGDGAVVESLSFPFMVDYMQRTGAKLATVPVDADGMDVEAVPKALHEIRDSGLRPKMIYVIPSYQVPTGTLLPLERRRRLVEVAQEWGVMVVEDNCYHDLYFGNPPPPTLFSLDDTGLVIQTDSFSKIIAPGLRLGWMTGVPEAIAPAAAVRQDLGVSQLTARALDLYLKDGMLEPRLEMLRPKYKRKRDLALSALQEHCGDFLSYVVPEGGVYFWLQVDDRVDCARVSEMLAADGVACRPGERFTDDPRGRQFFRMAFLHVPEEEINRGIELLGRSLRASLSG
jgi:2-aminoadipate transaminase